MTSDHRVTMAKKTNKKTVKKKAAKKAAKRFTYKPVEEVTRSDKMGRIRLAAPVKKPLPKGNAIKRYILTSAQNNTALHTKFWNNLLAYAEYLQAEVHVARLVYVKKGLGALGQKDVLVKQSDLMDEMVWSPHITPYLSDETLQLAPGLRWLGELNILPTAQRPLSGLTGYSEGDSAIVPHTRWHITSVATRKHEDPILQYTTGAVTKVNYIMRKTGLQAAFHHVYSAAIVEVNSKGQWWVRHLRTDTTGAFYDLDVHVTAGQVHKSNSVDAIVFGDVHVVQMSPEARKAICGNKKSMCQVLKPKYVVLHDTLDFRARNHHERDNFKANLLKHESGKDDVLWEVKETCKFVSDISKQCGKVYITESNHDQALGRWLEEADYRKDPKNAEFYLEAQLAQVQAWKKGNYTFNTFEWAHNKLQGKNDKVHFLREDESFSVKGVEMGYHGHRGPNGARGSLFSFSKISMKVTIGHIHTAGALDSAVSVGFNGTAQEYAKGPSSWSATQCIQYPNGKRTLITFRGSQWRA